MGATLVFTCLDFAGVVPLSVFNTAHSASQGKFLFCVQNEVTPPPKGGGAGYHLSWVGRVGSVRSKLGHAGSTRPTLFLAGAGPLPGLQNRTQGHTGPSLVLTVFSWCASFAAVLPTGIPSGNSPPREWAEPCKAASRFSRSRPMSTRLFLSIHAEKKNPVVSLLSAPSFCQPQSALPFKFLPVFI